MPFVFGLKNMTALRPNFWVLAPPLRAVGVCAVQARCPCDNSLAGADVTPESVPVTYLPPSRSGGQVSRGTEAACVLTVIRVVDGE